MVFIWSGSKALSLSVYIDRATPTNTWKRPEKLLTQSGLLPTNRSAPHQHVGPSRAGNDVSKAGLCALDTCQGPATQRTPRVDGMKLPNMQEAARACRRYTYMYGDGTERPCADRVRVS